MKFVRFLRKENTLDGQVREVFALSCDPVYVSRALIALQGDIVVLSAVTARVSGNFSGPGRIASVSSIRDLAMIRFDGLSSVVFNGYYGCAALSVSVDFDCVQMSVTGSDDSVVASVSENVHELVEKLLTRRS